MRKFSTFNLKLAALTTLFWPDMRLLSTIFNYAQHLFIMHIF